MQEENAGTSRLSTEFYILRECARFTDQTQTPCSSALAFQTSYHSYAQRHVTHSLKCPFHRGPCNKVIYHNQRCSGVERSSVGNYAIMMSVTQWRLMLSNVWSRSITLEMLHPVLLGRACMASRHVRSSFDDFL